MERRSTVRVQLMERDDCGWQCVDERFHLANADELYRHSQQGGTRRLVVDALHLSRQKRGAIAREYLAEERWRGRRLAVVSKWIAWLINPRAVAAGGRNDRVTASVEFRNPSNKHCYEAGAVHRIPQSLRTLSLWKA